MKRNHRSRFAPSLCWLLAGAVAREIHSLPWREPRTAALFTLWGNANAGVMCPVSMTYAAVPALRDGAPRLAEQWEARLTSTDYDRGALAGMAMTERQGGSDVRANITRADPIGDGLYELRGHKWFCSYPPCDIFLVLAQAPGGLSCFAVERGPGMEFQRLKDKLGTRSLPSSEVELHGIAGRLVGEEGRGVPAIIRMVNHTRLDCLLGAATGLRRGTLEPCTTPAIAACSAPGWSTSRRCSMCWPTSRSSPRPRRRRRCGSRAATTSPRRPPCAGSGRR